VASSLATEPQHTSCNPGSKDTLDLERKHDQTTSGVKFANFVFDTGLDRDLEMEYTVSVGEEREPSASGGLLRPTANLSITWQAAKVRSHGTASATDLMCFSVSDLTQPSEGNDLSGTSCNLRKSCYA